MEKEDINKFDNDVSILYKKADGLKIPTKFVHIGK